MDSISILGKEYRVYITWRALRRYEEEKATKSEEEITLALIADSLKAGWRVDGNDASTFPLSDEDIEMIAPSEVIKFSEILTSQLPQSKKKILLGR